MKKLLSIISMLFLGSSVYATTYMCVKTKNERVKEFDTEKISLVYYEDEIVDINPSELEGELGGHSYVNLGLPSGTMWATSNMSGFYRWGETKPFTSSPSSIDAKLILNQWNGVPMGELLAQDVVDGVKDTTYSNSLGRLTPAYDVASVNWGNAWRMPTYDEIIELKTLCKWEWTEQGTPGCIVTGPNGKSIFLPAAGYNNYGQIDKQGKLGYYWTSSKLANDSYNLSYYLLINNNGPYCRYTDISEGNAVRPVFSASPKKYMYVVTTDNQSFKYPVEKVLTVDFEERTDIPKLESNTGDHAYVDLGLPSGIKWATCNVGANSQEESGDYFAWGETKTRTLYDYENSVFRNSKANSLQEQGVIDRIKDTTDVHSLGRLTDMYDAATVNWGGTWRIPTLDEVAELKKCCTWIWTNMKNVNGYIVVGPNGNAIFLPVTGQRYWGTTYDNNYGMYLISSANTNALTYKFTFNAPDIIYNKPYVYWPSGYSISGCSVRPVSW